MEKLIDKFVGEFKNFEKSDGIAAQEIHPLRLAALDRLKKFGLPTSKDENWRNTKTDFLNEYNFKLQTERPDNLIDQSVVDDLKSSETDEICVVILNGFYCPELTELGELNRHVVVSGLEDAVRFYGKDIEKMMLKSDHPESDGYYELNTAFARGGVYIKVPEGVYPDRPIRLLSINDAHTTDVMTQPRNLIVVGKNAGCRIVESVNTIGDNASFSNMLTEIRMGKGSNVEYDKVQNDTDKSYYIGSVLVDQKRDSVYNSTYVSLGGKFVRNYTNARLRGIGSEANFNGLYFVDGEDFIDNHTLVDHIEPNCSSRELFKGILNDKSVGVFRGKVIVHPDAQKTNAFQANNNILMSDDAKIFTKPQLEIYADDVKCSHGATSGNLDKESLFYMQARGIGEEVAKALLLNAFAGEVIEKVHITGLRDEIKRLVAKRLTVEDLYFCDVL
ncbi:MAG: Fe-S cluster assembly protein SufD [Candidatus Kapabacteria bacterium]|jgi:Fe-S cluster assembly protein SufD|nr:Fe-S cluster assembly protein SufD [Candidatus Kapabacteria bacterium]